MILDHEEQRALLIDLIDGVPVQGPMASILELATKVQALKNAISAAGVRKDKADD